jgi:hypothetical protein
VPVVDGISPTKDPSDRGLAGSGLADRAKGLAAPDFEIEAVQRLQDREPPGHA